MDYHVPSKDSIISFWIPFFQALSISEFELFAWRWGLYIESSPELRGVAKNFTLAVSVVLGYSVPESVPEIDFGAEVNTGEKLRLLWQTAFSQLEGIGHSEAILDWYKYYDDLYKSLEFSVRVSEWDGLLLAWARNSEAVKRQPPLAQPVRLQLQLTILRHWVEYYKSSDDRYELEKRARATTLLDRWTQFVVLDGIGTWLINLGSFFAQVSYWKAIFGLLTPRQIAKLETWGQKEFTYPSNSSLVELSERLEGITLK